MISVVGARPQFIKCAALYRRYPHRVLHTGQHEDFLMSEAFFEDLGLPKPIQVHTHRLTDMIRAIRPHLSAPVVVYGDTRSTLAGALAAQGRYPVAHIEAGCRSFHPTMPEELIRTSVDHVSTYRFCSTIGAKDHLEHEGITENVHVVGDLMIDLLPREPHEKTDVVLLTLHRLETLPKLNEIMAAFEGVRAVFPVHPHTKTKLRYVPSSVTCVKPFRYFEMVAAMASARLIVTDSGGVQKEAAVLGTPCLTVRDETEWPETLAYGWNRLVSPATLRENLLNPPQPQMPFPKVYGDGLAADRIVAVLKL